MVDRCRTCVEQERDVASTRVLVTENADFEGKRSGEIGSSVNVSFFRSEVGFRKVIDCGRGSLLKKLFRVTGFVLRFVHNLKAFLGRCEVTKRGLLLEEIEKSRLAW